MDDRDWQIGELQAIMQALLQENRALQAILVGLAPGGGPQAPL